MASLHLLKRDNVVIVDSIKSSFLIRDRTKLEIPEHFTAALIPVFDNNHWSIIVGKRVDVDPNWKFYHADSIPGSHDEVIANYKVIYF